MMQREKHQDVERVQLEQEAIEATRVASSQILSCIVTNWGIHILRLRDNTFSIGIVAVLLSMAVFLLSWIVNLASLRPSSLQVNLSLFVASSLNGLAFFVVRVLHDSILPPNRNLVAELPVDREGFIAFRDWFSTRFAPLKQVTFSLLVGAAAVVTVKLLSEGLPDLVSPGLYVAAFFGMFAIGNGVYCALVIPTLASAVSNYRLRLFPYDPASTLAIRVASAGFGKLALANGVVATLVIALIFALNPWQKTTTFLVSLAWLIGGWMVVTYSFVFPHYHMSKVIVREKQIQLKKLETLIGTYHMRLEELSEQEIDRLEKLLDLRNKLLKTRNTALNISGWRDYISSLVLPTLSFITGALDLTNLIKNWFSR